MGRSNGCYALVLGLAALLTTGCRITKNRDGNQKDVSIDTPLGGLQVKTDPGAVLGKVGLPAYPGAQAVQEDGDDKHSADVNLSFGSFQLKVLAAGLQTTDSPAQVEAFYRKALAQFSDVIACRNQQPVGTATRTGMGLTCADEKHTKTVHVDTEDRPGLELKAGSPRHQHIVSIRRQDDRTRMELIALELPNIGGDDGN